MSQGNLDREVKDIRLQVRKIVSENSYAHKAATEPEIEVCAWLREISPSSGLTVARGPTWVLLSKTYKPYFFLCIVLQMIS